MSFALRKIDIAPSRSSEPSDWADHLARDGYCIIPGAFDRSIVSALAADLVDGLTKRRLATVTFTAAGPSALGGC